MKYSLCICSRESDSVHCKTLVSLLLNLTLISGNIYACHSKRNKSKGKLAGTCWRNMQVPYYKKHDVRIEKDLNHNYMGMNFNIMNMHNKLHWISSVAALEVVFPRMLLATHRYSPLSTLLTFVIVNCLLSAAKLILELIDVFTGYPSLVHNIVGTGFAVALQDNVTLFPSVSAPLRGWTVISGWSVTIKQSFL